MNKIFLMGRITKDPETKTTQSSQLVSTFTLAVNRRMSKNNEADFLQCVSFGKQAEFAKNYLVKGKQIIVIGRLQTRSWNDNEGKKRYVTEVIVEEFNFAGGKKEDNEARLGKAPDKADEKFYPDEEFDSESDLPF